MMKGRDGYGFNNHDCVITKRAVITDVFGSKKLLNRERGASVRHFENRQAFPLFPHDVLNRRRNGVTARFWPGSQEP